MNLSLRIFRIICMFTFCSLRKNRTVVKKRTLRKNTKQQSKNKNDSDVQSKADSDEDHYSETVIGKAPLKKQDHSSRFVMDSQNPVHATKS